MNSIRAAFGFRTGVVAVTTLLILAGASLNASGRVGWATAFAGLAGLLALAAGVIYTTWRGSVPAAAAPIIFTLPIGQFNPRPGDLALPVPGLALLGARGAPGGVADRNLAGAIRGQA